QLVTELEIAWIEAVRTRDVRGRAGVPFTALHNHRGVWDQLIPAAMVEMEMRVDDEIDTLGVAVNRFQPRADLLTWAKADLEQLGHSLAKSSNGNVLAVGMQASIEQRAPFRMLDQKNGNRHGYADLGGLHQAGSQLFQWPASQ